MQWADLTTQRFKAWVLRDSHRTLKKHWGTIQQETAVSGKYQISLKGINFLYF